MDCFIEIQSKSRCHFLVLKWASLIFLGLCSTPDMYLDISLELRNIFDLASIVEGNFPKRKWIMGVCDLNY
ncbi:hypothetical protein Hdeb2414_s1343g01017661 [Helianthus debilis subsp. tardiflorus]